MTSTDFLDLLQGTYEFLANNLTGQALNSLKELPETHEGIPVVLRMLWQEHVSYYVLTEYRQAAQNAIEPHALIAVVVS